MFGRKVVPSAFGESRALAALVSGTLTRGFGVNAELLPRGRLSSLRKEQRSPDSPWL